MAEIDIAKNPSRSDLLQIARLCGDQSSWQVRGLVFPDGVSVIFPADQAIHYEIQSALGYDDAWDDSEHGFYARVNEDSSTVFIGNISVVKPLMPNFHRLFDRYDLVGDETTEYEDSEWGLPARFGGYAANIG